MSRSMTQCQVMGKTTDSRVATILPVASESTGAAN